MIIHHWSAWVGAGSTALSPVLPEQNVCISCWAVFNVVIVFCAAIFSFTRYIFNGSENFGQTKTQVNQIAGGSPGLVGLARVPYLDTLSTVCKCLWIIFLKRWSVAMADANETFIMRCSSQRAIAVAGEWSCCERKLNLYGFFFQLRWNLSVFKQLFATNGRTAC